ncbi:MAG: HAMP domain-containing protein [Candidatus Omnitrophica bacterium]|nr:HAMP domain-containing protein [Candidatus Omnitrophota bacterium]
MSLKSHQKITLTFGLLVAFVLFGLYFYLDQTLQFSKIPASAVHLERFLWIAVLISVALAIFLNFILSHRITRPIERISKIAQAIAAGDFSQKISLWQNDEIADLAKAVDFMSLQIRYRMDDVTTAKSRLEAVFLSMVEGVMVVNTDGKILLINETLKKILRVEHQAVGRKPLEVIRNIEVQDIVDRALEFRQIVNGREMSFFLPEEKILRVHAAPVLRDGKADGAVLVFHDITDLRRLETIRKDFVANVSHEFRTPVANIKGYSETLLDGAIEDKDHARDFLKIIYSESDRLAKLVDDLLLLARSELDRPVLDLKPCSIAKIVDWSLAGLTQQINQHELKVRLDIPQNLPQVKADDSAVSQIFLNLIENAIKYNKAGGEILISATIKGDWVEVCIADTGIGIPPQDLPRVFERFYRVDKSHSRDIPGTGLGLSIVKHIIQAHGGDIRAQSQLGQGSTFCFTLPAV